MFGHDTSRSLPTPHTLIALPLSPQIRLQQQAHEPIIRLDVRSLFSSLSSTENGKVPLSSCTSDFKERKRGCNALEKQRDGRGFFTEKSRVRKGNDEGSAMKDYISPAPPSEIKLHAAAAAAAALRKESHEQLARSVKWKQSRMMETEEIRTKHYAQPRRALGFGDGAGERNDQASAKLSCASLLQTSLRRPAGVRPRFFTSAIAKSSCIGSGEESEDMDSVPNMAAKSCAYRGLCKK
jgi:hypothetical protein